MFGIDIDKAMLEIAQQTTAAEGLSVSFRQTTSWHTGLADNSVDIVFCHQTFHHLVEQEAALKEFRRILRPGGLLLFAESTRKYIHSWIIRLLFRHPMDVQRTAEEYLATLVSEFEETGAGEDEGDEARAEGDAPADAGEDAQAPKGA